MAKKEVLNTIKLQIEAGKANPAPPIGPVLGQNGVNIMDFCKQFNAATQKEAGTGIIYPVVISVYKDRSFTFILKTPPVTFLIKRAAKIESGSATPNSNIVAKITKAQVKEIAEKKMVDLNTDNIDSAMRLVAGSARSMGVQVID